MRRLISSLVVASFCLTGSAAFAQLGAVKEGAKKAGSATKEAGKATVQTTYVCADVTTDQATVKTNACRDHGGVRPEAKQRH